VEFPFSYFLGQVVAALVTGNTVIAKAASQTPFIAQRAVELLYDAGILHDASQLIFGHSHDLGDSLFMSQALAGVAFTGSTATASSYQPSAGNTIRAIIPFIRGNWWPQCHDCRQLCSP